MNSIHRISLLMFILMLATPFRAVAQGELLWSKSYGSSSTEWPQSFITTSDGGALIVGHADRATKAPDLYLVKINSEFELEWEQVYPHYADDEDGSAVETPDGGYLVCGTWHVTPERHWRYGALMKIDSHGEVEWEREYIWEDAQLTFRKIFADGDDYLIAIRIWDGFRRLFYYRVNLDGDILDTIETEVSMAWEMELDTRGNLVQNHVSAVDCVNRSGQKLGGAPFDGYIYGYCAPSDSTIAATTVVRNVTYTTIKNFQHEVLRQVEIPAVGHYDPDELLAMPDGSMLATCNGERSIRFVLIPPGEGELEIHDEPIIQIPPNCSFGLYQITRLENGNIRALLYLQLGDDNPEEETRNIGTDIALVEFDDELNLIHFLNPGRSLGNTEYVVDGVGLEDGGMLLLLKSWVNPDVTCKPVIMKVDAEGDSIWSRQFGSAPGYFEQLEVDLEGNYWVLTQAGDIMKLNPELDTLFTYHDGDLYRSPRDTRKIRILHNDVGALYFGNAWRLRTGFIKLLDSDGRVVAETMTDNYDSIVLDAIGLSDTSYAYTLTNGVLAFAERDLVLLRYLYVINDSLVRFFSGIETAPDGDLYVTYGLHSNDCYLSRITARGENVWTSNLGEDQPKMLGLEGDRALVLALQSTSPTNTVSIHIFNTNGGLSSNFYLPNHIEVSRSTSLFRTQPNRVAIATCYSIDPYEHTIYGDITLSLIELQRLSIPGESGDHFTPCSLSLSAFPNPFNSTLTIHYTGGLETAGTRLAIYDINGREVANLLGSTGVSAGQGIHPAAEGRATVNKIFWDASASPAGVYFVRIEAGGEVLTKKVVLMR